MNSVQIIDEVLLKDCMDAWECMCWKLFNSKDIVGNDYLLFYN